MFNSRDLLPVPLQSDELIQLMGEIIDPFFLGGYEIVSIDLGQSITIDTGDYFILSSPSKRVMFYFVKAGDDPGTIHGTYAETVIVTVPTGILSSDIPQFVLDSIKHISYFKFYVDNNKLYAVGTEIGKTKYDHFFSPKFEDRATIEEVGFSIISENDTRVIVDALALKIFSQFGIENQEAVMAYFNMTIKPIIGTLNCVENLIKMLDISASVTEWYETSYLYPYKFVINLSDNDTNTPIQDFIDLVLLIKNERSWLAKIGTPSCHTPLPWDTFYFDVAPWDDIEGIKYKGVKVCRKMNIAAYGECLFGVDGYGITFEDSSLFAYGETKGKWTGDWRDCGWDMPLSSEMSETYGYREMYPVAGSFGYFMVPDPLVPSETLSPSPTLTPMGSFRYVNSVTPSSYTGSGEYEVIATGSAGVIFPGSIEVTSDKTILAASIEVKLPGVGINVVNKIILSSATIVGVFIYDTTRDTDLGAWVNNAITQSWYIETLNTATRGKRSKFPKVVLIVATTSNVTIYDATDPDCPMWMVFLGATNNWIFNVASYPKTSISMKNGVLCVGHSAGGVVRISFLADNAKYYQSSGWGYCNGTVSQRNSALAYTVGGGAGTGIINNYINDVAMTTVSRAVNGFGLLDPVIAVGTNEGVSILDGPGGVGTIVDIVGGDGNNNVTKIFFDDNNQLWFSIVEHVSVGRMPIPSVDTSIASIYANFAHRYFNSYLTVAPHSFGAPAHISKDSFGSTSGLTRISEDLVTPTNGMNAFISNSFNTGWMKGDIRRAIFCDADGTTDTMVNLVSNGTFDTNTTGWTADNGSLLSVSGELQTTNTTGGTPNGAYRTISGLIIGRRYTVSTIARRGTCEVDATLWVNPGSTTGAGYGSKSNATTTNALLMVSFVATNTSVTIYLRAFATTAGKTAYYDNVILSEGTSDYSIKLSDFILNGTLTKTPVATGSELQCVSGFANGCSLSQPYSADLDFGTANFYIYGWFKIPTGSVTRKIVERLTPATSLQGFSIYVTAAHKLVFAITDDSFASYDIIVTDSDSMDDNQWRFFVSQRVDSKLELWINETKAATDVNITAALASLSNSTAELRIGTSAGGVGSAFTGGSMTEIKIGGGYLTPSQISKIYQDELQMFQPDTKITIQGTSTAVTALTYNEDSDRLLVGTSNGVTVFDGLIVDSNFFESSSRSYKSLSSVGVLTLEGNTADSRVIGEVFVPGSVSLILCDYNSWELVESHNYDITNSQWNTITKHFDNLGIGEYGIALINNKDSSIETSTTDLRNPEFGLLSIL